MPRTPEVRGLIATPLGIAFDKETDTVDITFLVEKGDHLHILLSPGGLEILFRHIEHVSSQMPAPFGPETEN